MTFCFFIRNPKSDSGITPSYYMAPQCFARINVHCRKKYIIEGSSFSFMGVTIKKVIPYGKKHLSRNRNAACCDFIAMINWRGKRGEYLRCALLFAHFVLLRSGWCRLISLANGCKSKLGSRRRVCSMGKTHRCS